MRYLIKINGFLGYINASSLRERLRTHEIFKKDKIEVHLSKVLTDHFSNSLSEKTTNDIPKKFSQCHFKSTFYRL